MKFRVDYVDKEDDYHKCWVEADSSEDAKTQAKKKNIGILKKLNM